MKYVINSSVPLRGSINISGAKNSAIKILAASLLCDQEIILENPPNTLDVKNFIALLQETGIFVDIKSDGRVALNAKDANSFEIPKEAKYIKPSTFLIGPLLARFGKAILPKNPSFKIDLYLDVLKTLGVKVSEKSTFYKFESASLSGFNINFEKNTPTGTDIAILLAVTANGTTTITNAAEEPEIDDLIQFLTKVGANVKMGIENPREITVEGVRYLSGGFYSVIPDRNETAFYISSAIFTNGDIVIKNCNPSHLTAFLSKLNLLGAGYEVTAKDELRVWCDEKTVLNPVNIETRVYPGFAEDFQALFSVLLTKAKGTSIVKETEFEGGFDFAKELNGMGAGIEIGREQMEIKGPVMLKGARVQADGIISGTALIVAGLGAKGKTEVLGAEIIDNSFEDIIGKLASLGAVIKKV